MKLSSWRSKHKGLSQTKAAELLFMARRGYQDAEAASSARPTLLLATKYLDMMLAPTMEQAAYILRQQRKAFYKK